MTEPRAQRTLVKSPPELWAEISDPDALTRRLGELGEIRITRLEAESTVAWEGDRIRGTVELEASGWGTKVTLTAQSTVPEPAPIAAEEEAAPVAAPARDAAPLASAEPAPPAEPAPAVPAPATRRPGLLALFRRRPRGSIQPVPAAVTASPPAPPTPLPAPPAPDPAAPVIAAAPPSPPNVEAVLEAALDDLGFAQKRPFRR